MNTPILDYLNAYRASGMTRLHMPGHKGRTVIGPEALDITEIQGADELYQAEGIIAESERNAAHLFGTALTLYSVEGSSHCIRSMILLAKQKYDRQGRNRILAARNAHKAFLYALALYDIEPIWVYPDRTAENSAAACGMTPDMLRESLLECARVGEMPFAVYVTSPDYLGQCADIAGLSDVCREAELPLLVDNAHGAYLHFLEVPTHPMDLGAMMCCDSAHKTLPALTGAAYLHIAENEITCMEAKAAMEVSGTTSPSYLILASLDACNQILAERYVQELKLLTDRLNSWKADQLEWGIPIVQSEPLKVVVDAAKMGFTGVELGDLLRSCGAEPEFCDADYLVCMLTPENSPEDLERLSLALLKARDERRKKRNGIPLRLMELPRRMGIREALLAAHEDIPLSRAEGRICGAPTVSCPPAVPLAVTGEELTHEVLQVMEIYGIKKVSVVKDE